MTHSSSSNSAADSTAMETSPRPDPEEQGEGKSEASGGCLGLLWVSSFRLVILLASGGLAIGAGIAIATRYPAEVEKPPLLEQILQGIEMVR